jgi:6-phosphogluconolactonase
MQLQVFDTPVAAAQAAASFIAAQARQAVAERGRFLLAVSGGRTPWLMLDALAGLDLPWNAVHLFQVDERVAPKDSGERNFSHINTHLLARVPLPAAQVHPMPVDEPDLDAAARNYAARLCAVAGTPPVLDLVHLGLGNDGHTASLVPGDPVLDVTDHAVAASGEYQGRRRLTLTFPVLNAARCRLWLVTGAEKADALRQLRKADPGIPAGKVAHDPAWLFADRSACID